MRSATAAAATGEVRPGLPRWFEVPAAALGLLLLSPLLLMIAVAVRLSSRGPILFRQERVGRGGRPFVMLKFRSMRMHAGGAQITRSGDPRITAVGRLLRKTKLDELPELWNVLRGDMSLVGPRPEVPRFVDLGDPSWQTVLAVRPGLTDPVTLSLRNEEELLAKASGDPEEYYRNVLQPRKLRGYAVYLHGRSWWTDVKVLAKTMVAVLLSRHSSAPSPENPLCLKSS